MREKPRTPPIQTAKNTAKALVRRHVPYPVRHRVARARGRAPETAAAPPASTPRPPTRAERLSAMSLTELGRKFGTDKAGLHRYTGHYERHLAHLRDQPMSMLEIGIGGANLRRGGASLRMWKWYFPLAQVVGLDIEDKSHVEGERIHVYQGDQSDPEVLRRMHAEHGPFQVIIDDGSHVNEHVRASFEVLFPLLADDGIYVIEDTQTSYWPTFGGSEDTHAPHTMLAMVKDLTDGLNHEEYVDERREPSYTDLHVVGVHCYHNLVFIEKGDAVEGTHRRRNLYKYYVEHPEKRVDPAPSGPVADPGR